MSKSIFFLSYQRREWPLDLPLVAGEFALSMQLYPVSKMLQSRTSIRTCPNLLDVRIAAKLLISPCEASRKRILHALPKRAKSFAMTGPATPQALQGSFFSGVVATPNCAKARPPALGSQSIPTSDWRPLLCCLPHGPIGYDGTF